MLRGEPRNGEGEALRKELPVAARVDARDLRSAWAAEGTGEEDRLCDIAVGGGGDGNQSLWARVASSSRVGHKAQSRVIFEDAPYLFPILCGGPAVICIVGTEILVVSALICRIRPHKFFEWSVAA